jgi:hypothetical protein
MAIPGIEKIKALAFKYSKKQLGNLVQLGMVDLQEATLAGFMRDRIAKEDMQPPTTTVAQDTLGLPAIAIAQQPPMPQQPQMPQGAPAPAPQAPPPMMAASGGLASLPADNVGNYAGGGIVAFDEGGEVPGYAGGNLIDEKFRTSDPAKINQAKLDILRAELAEEQRNLGLETDPTKKARIQANITAITSEIDRVSRSPSPQTSMEGFGRVTNIPRNDPRIASQRDAMSLPAINPPAAAPTLKPQDYISQAREITNMVYPDTDRPKSLSVQEAMKQSNDLLKEAGFDPDIFKKQGRDIAEERAGIAKDREEAKTFRILEGAAGILSGTSPFASVNIGKGVSPAVQGLASDMKEFQKNERALRAAERDLTMAEQKFNLTRASDALAQMNRAQDRFDKYTEKKAGLIGDLTKSFISVQGQKEVAETYGRSYENLERLRQTATPDSVKSLNTLAAQLRQEDPTLTIKQSLEEAAILMRPERSINAVIGAESKAAQDVDKRYSEMLLTDKTLRALDEKANAGDADAQRQRKEIKDRMLRERMSQMPTVSSRTGAPREALAPQDRQALEWANANPSDPRSAQIKQRLGVQ